PEVGESKLLGYYQAKAMKERIYRRLVPADQLLMFRSAQWFDLVDSMTFALGPLRFVPKMRVQALAAAEAARMMAEAIDAGEHGTIEAAGAEVSDFAASAERVARERARAAGDSKARKVIGLLLPCLTSVDGLILDAPRVYETGLEDWLRTPLALS